MESEFISAAEAVGHANVEPIYSRWPTRRDNDCRLEPEAWPAVSRSFALRPGAKIFTIGSCFARNIEEHLLRLGFNLPTLDFSVPRSEWMGRPNGIINKFTPPAIFQELQWTAEILQRNGEFKTADALDHLLELDGGAIVDMGLAGYLPVTLERAIERRRQLYVMASHAFTSEVVVITPGLIEAWFDKERKVFIQNAPNEQILRRYPNRFAFKILNFEETRRFIFDSITLIRQIGLPDTKFLLTTSPVPLKCTFTTDDVIVANMYGKSMLRVVVDDASKSFPQVDYFPSYENVLLTKSMHVWSDDLRHVNDEFVSQIVARMIRAYIDVPTGEKDQMHDSGPLRPQS